MNFCVKCGRDCAESLDGMCIDCWLDGRVFVVLPHHVDLKVCTNCGEFCIRERWHKMETQDAVIRAASEAAEYLSGARIVDGKADIECKDPYVYEVTLEPTLDVMGVEVEGTASTIVRIKNSVCKTCSRKLGSYYTSILQIRSGQKDPGLTDEALRLAEKSVERQAAANRQLFITKVEQVPGGADVYLSSITLGRSLMKELGDAYCAETKESPKLVGKTPDGQDMYRLTYLVRLPDYHVGDVVVSDGRYCKLVRVSGTGGRVLDLMDFRERAVRKTDMPSLKVYEKASDLREAEVISRSGSEILVMNPDMLGVSELRTPEGYEAPETVRVVSVDGFLYLVP